VSVEALGGFLASNPRQGREGRVHGFLRPSTCRASSFVRASRIVRRPRDLAEHVALPL
jgi:hypothetical protein